MVGLIQKLLFDLVEKKAGVEAVNTVKARAGVPLGKTFRLGEVYSDSEWQSLLRAACEVLGITEDQAMEAYADVFGNDARERFPTWFQVSKNSRMFLEQQITIHNVFASGVRDPEARKAVQDKFHIELVDKNKIITHYRSPNKLCSLYEALARWLFAYYGDEASLEQTKCMKRGNDECEIHVHWSKFRTPTP